MDAFPEALAGRGEVVHVGHAFADEEGDVGRGPERTGLGPRVGDDIPLTDEDATRATLPPMSIGVYVFKP